MPNQFIKTIRKDGSVVGNEVSRQRRWQLRNPEKAKEIADRYEKSPKRLEQRQKYYQTLKYKKRMPF